MCSLHLSDVCVCMRDMISEFNFEINGSQPFCTLMLFMCVIVCLMSYGSRLHVECILHYGISHVYIMFWVQVLYTR